MTRDELIQITRAWLEAFNNAEWGAERELLATEVTQNLATPRGVRAYVSDTDNTIAWLEEIKRKRPSLVGTLADSGWTVDESRNTAIGTVTCAVTTASGVVETSGLLIVSAVDDRINEIKTYVDPECGCL